VSGGGSAVGHGSPLGRAAYQRIASEHAHVVVRKPLRLASDEVGEQLDAGRVFRARRDGRLDDDWPTPREPHQRLCCGTLHLGIVLCKESLDTPHEVLRRDVQRHQLFERF
jgi:hypothetical protein